jgi:hypothetical protein
MELTFEQKILAECKKDKITFVKKENKRAYFICSKNHEYSKDYSKYRKDRVYCPYCIREQVLKNWFNRLAETKKLDILLEDTIALNLYKKAINASFTKYELRLRCKNNHIFTCSYGARTYSCSICEKESIFKNYSLLTANTQLKIIGEYRKEVNYANPETKTRQVLQLECPNGHVFERESTNLFKTQNCPICGISKFQQSIFNFIKDEIGIEDLEQNKQKICSPYELDIYSSKHLLAVETHGNYHHSYNYQIEHGKDPKQSKYKHVYKADLAEQKGIKLLQIFEDEWLYKQEIVKGLLRNAFGDREQKSVDARKCEVKEVLFKESEIFLKENHIHGAGLVGVIRLGLYFESFLVALLTFEKGNSSSKNIISENPNEFELYKYCTNCNVRGGLGKLLGAFKQRYNPEIIRTYIDRRFFNGNSFINQGFEVIGKTEPNYYYFGSDLVRKHRYNFRTKDGITEKQKVQELGLLRIYDAGHLKLLWRQNEKK